MAFRFYIDGFLTDQPDNDRDLITTITRDRELGGMFVNQDVTLKYSNKTIPAGLITSGYAYLKSQFDSGTCNEATIAIFDYVAPTETYPVYTGVIKVNSMKVNEQQGSLESKVDDNNFYSYVKNNGNVKFNLYANKTKNGLSITPPDIYVVDMFQSEPFSYLSVIGNYYYGYRVYDVLRFLVPAISDNKVTFQSDYLQNLGDLPGDPGNPIELFIFDGFALSHANTGPQVFASFNQIVKEIFKLKNTFFYIDQSDPASPILRLEHISWFYTGSNVLSFTEPLDLSTYVDATKLYGTVKVGASYNPGGTSPAYSWPTGTSYFGWDEELYTPFGQCNVDTELDLMNEFYISSNAVSDQVIGAVDANKDQMFLVECASIDLIVHSANAVAYTTYSDDPVNKRFYNIGSNNVNKLNIHGSNFQAALTNTQTAGSDVCRIATGQDEFIMNQNAGSGLVSTFTTPALKAPVSFADELGPGLNDPGANWDNLLYYYTVPTDGDYSFGVNLDLEFLNFKECQNTISIPNLVGTFTQQFGVQVTVSIKAYTDNTFAAVIDQASQMFQISQNGVDNYGVSLVAPLVAGNVVRVETSSQFIVLLPDVFGSTPLSQAFINLAGICTYTSTEPKAQVINLSSSIFECNGTPDGSAVVSQPALDLFKSKVSEFMHDITPTDFRKILNLPTGSFQVVKDGATRTGWVDEIKYNNWTGRASIKLISSDANITL